MFCSNCGKELRVGARFCGGCGMPVMQSEKDPAQSRKNVKKKRVFTIVWTAIAAIGAALVLITILGRGLHLKYEWGTHRSEIEQNEAVLGVREHRLGYNPVEYVLTCDDPHHKVDTLDELADTEEVQYWVDYAGYLYRIYYSIDEELSIKERLDIVCSHYGDNYYVGKYGYDDARDYHYYWWVGDTVIELCSYGIDYYDQSHYLGSEHMRNQYDDLLAYFGKS